MRIYRRKNTARKEIHNFVNLSKIVSKNAKNKELSYFHVIMERNFFSVITDIMKICQLL